jgi:hypothetical protein
MVNGHTHANGISAHARNATTPLGNLVTGAPGGFWEVNTAAHIDWPSQSRIVELAAGLANPTRQTVSVFTTMVDISAPAGFNGDTSTPTSLASLARELAANDPTERLRPANASRAGRPADRNTQLLVPAPFDLPLPQRWGSSIALATNQDGRLQLFGTNPLDGIYQQAEQTAGSDTWAGWNQIAGSFRAVSAETAGDGRIALAATNSAGVVFYTTQTTAGGTAMNSWTLLGPADARSVALARNSDGHMEVFVVLGTGQVWHIWQTSAGGPFGAWSTGFGRSGTRMVQATVATNSDGRVELFLLDASGGIWHRAEILAGGWTDWTALAAPANTWFVQLTVATNRNGQLQLFLIDNGRRIWTGRQTSAGSATWTAFSPLDPVHGPQGRMTQLTARLGGTGLVELFGVDHASGIWYRRQTATNAFESWTAWTSMWGVLRSDVPAPPPGSTIGNPPPQAVTVPRIVDQTTSDADAILINAGLTVGKTATTGTCIGKGLVYSQSPTPGKVVDAGTPVNYTYATC